MPTSHSRSTRRGSARASVARPRAFGSRKGRGSTHSMPTSAAGSTSSSPIRPMSPTTMSCRQRSRRGNRRALLRSGPDGLDDLRPIVSGAATWLRAGGAVIVELDPRQATVVVDLCASGGLTDARSHHDLVGRERFVSARRS